MRMCDENYRPRITLRRLEPQPPPPGFYQTELADRTAGLIGYNDRPRPSTIYPQREPVGEYYGSHFVLKFPEITLTPKLKEALLLSMQSDARDKSTEFRIGDKETVEIEALGDRTFRSDLHPVNQRLLAMLQAGLEPDEMAELLLLFDGRFEITANTEGGVFFSSVDREITPSHLFKCIDKLLQLDFPGLAKDALREFHNNWVLQNPDMAKQLISSQISNQPWAAWARAELDKLG
jgi:hypothetical protein